MGSADIFMSSINTLIAALTILSVFLAVLVIKGKRNAPKGMLHLFWGILFEFIGNYVGYLSVTAPAQNPMINVEYLIVAELGFLLLSSIFLLNGALRLLYITNFEKLVNVLYGSLGVLSIWYFVFIYAESLTYMILRQSFPLIGFGAIATSFMFKRNYKYASGFIASGVVLYLMAAVSFLKLLTPAVESWYIAPILYYCLAFSLLVVVSNIMSQQMEVYKKKADESNNRLEEIVKASPFPIILSRLVDDQILLANHNAVKLFALEDEKPNRKLTDFFADQNNKKQLVEILENEKEVQDFEVLITTDFNDTPFWLLTSSRVIDFDNNVVLYSAFQDITSRKNREILLKNQATRDPLTRVYNRRYFDEEVTKKIVKSKEKGEDYSILMIDADHFKNVNDTFGHKTGDKVLMELAETCEKALRDSDVVARYGGEEFVIYLSNVNSKKAKVVADRLRQTISRLKVYSDAREVVTFTVSIGISGSEISDDIEVLVKAADDALYQAKENGRNRVELFLANDINKVKNGETKNISEIDKRQSNEEQEAQEEISLIG